jgi:hypothetical protein
MGLRAFPVNLLFTRSGLVLGFGQINGVVLYGYKEHNKITSVLQNSCKLVHFSHGSFHFFEDTHRHTRFKNDFDILSWCTCVYFCENDMKCDRMQEERRKEDDSFVS